MKKESTGFLPATKFLVGKRAKRVGVYSMLSLGGLWDVLGSLLMPPDCYR